MISFAFASDWLVNSARFFDTQLKISLSARYNVPTQLRLFEFGLWCGDNGSKRNYHILSYFRGVRNNLQLEKVNGI